MPEVVAEVELVEVQGDEELCGGGGKPRCAQECYREIRSAAIALAGLHHAKNLEGELTGTLVSDQQRMVFLVFSI